VVFGAAGLVVVVFARGCVGRGAPGVATGGALVAVALSVGARDVSGDVAGGNVVSLAIGLAVVSVLRGGFLLAAQAPPRQQSPRSGGAIATASRGLFMARSVGGAVKEPTYRERLIALRDHLATAIEGGAEDSRTLAALSKEYRAVLAELESLPAPEETSQSASLRARVQARWQGNAMA